MNLHILYNGGDGYFDVVNIKPDGEVEYIAQDFMDGDHAHAYINGWEAAGEYVNPGDEANNSETLNTVFVPASYSVEDVEAHTKALAAKLLSRFQYRD